MADDPYIDALSRRAANLACRELGLGDAFGEAVSEQVYKAVHSAFLARSGPARSYSKFFMLSESAETNIACSDEQEVARFLVSRPCVAWVVFSTDKAARQMSEALAGVAAVGIGLLAV